MTRFSNRLAGETSPYLLQHAHNPVNWYPWGEEALETARRENKPMLVSIGYAACHWCHVMEKESFEDAATAQVMNEHFINIKIDREERPDLDHIYMDAVQAMTGSGGWPLNVFLTPDGKPFYGGTYFPPRAVHNRPSWQQVLMGVSAAFTERRHEIDAQAENLTAHLLKSNDFGIGTGIPAQAVFIPENMQAAFENVMKNADREEGGFGRAPKFPQTFTIRFLLHYYYHTGNAEALQQACFSLDKMIRGGIYDQVGGGFARYATDTEWLVPHFEKMLYDNALLVTTMSEAYQCTKNILYKNTIEQVLAFIEREMLSPEMGFYSALDADSEGVEGKFYVWSKAEAAAVLQEDAAIFCRFYDITEQGNWEHSSILRVLVPEQEFAAANNLALEDLEALLARGREKLLAQRSTRIRPLLDDKQLLGWNALMNAAYSQAYAALGNEHYREIAVKNMDFMLTQFKAGNAFNHTYKAGQAKYPAFLDDYACLILALVQLQEITGETGYLEQARALTGFVLEHFSEEETGFFYFTHREQQDVIVRKKEVYDGAVPSGNSVMAANLHYLGIVFDELNWKERALQMCYGLQQAAVKYPTSFGGWTTMMLALTYGVSEIAIIGAEYTKLRSEFLRTFIPSRVFQSAPDENNNYPLLAQKSPVVGTKIFLCKEYACQTPVNEVDSLLQQLKQV